jgi:hypothetical protein
MIGKISTFGGVNDSGMTRKEGLSLYEHSEADKRPDLFVPRGTDLEEGTSQRLRPNGLYFAYRFDLSPQGGFNRLKLQHTIWMFRNPKNSLSVALSLVDWGPHENTDKTFDISPYASELLRVKTGEELDGYPI